MGFYKDLQLIVYAYFGFVLLVCNFCSVVFPCWDVEGRF